MAMPNRSKEVKEIVKRYPQTFGPPDDTLDTRRRLLIPIVARELNKIDGDNWFLLNRLDRNDEDPKPGRLTSDVIVWEPTREHVDVLSSSGGMWGEHPPITNPKWLLEEWDKWPSWDTQTPPVEDEPEPPPPPVVDPPAPPVDLTPILTKITEIVAGISNLEKRLVVLEAKPNPEFKLPNLEVVGSTSRAWGHGHEVRLDVKVKE